jgi:hypothetical protein
MVDGCSKAIGVTAYVVVAGGGAAVDCLWKPGMVVRGEKGIY